MSIENNQPDWHESVGVHCQVVQLFELKIGDAFRLRKNGKPYTIHCKAISERTNDTSELVHRYIIAVNNKKMYAFYNTTLVKKVV